MRFLIMPGVKAHVKCSMHCAYQVLGCHDKHDCGRLGRQPRLSFDPPRPPRLCRGLSQGPGGHIKPIPEDEDFVAGAPPATRTQTRTDHEALDRALAVRLQQASCARIPGHIRRMWRLLPTPQTSRKLCALAF